MAESLAIIFEDLLKSSERTIEKIRSSGRSKFTRSTEEQLKRSYRIESIHLRIEQEEILLDTFDLFHFDLAMIQWLTKTIHWTNEIRTDSDVDRSEKNERESFDEKHRETIDLFLPVTFRDKEFFQEGMRVRVRGRDSCARRTVVELFRPGESSFVLAG